MIESIVKGDSKKDIVTKLASAWSESGLNNGDMVLIHSSLSGFIKSYKEKEIFIGPGDILNSFIETVGNKGTLIFPTYNFGFTKGILFDIRNTRSETGILTESARTNENVCRTGHPLFSFAVIGFHQKEFENLINFSAFGNDSPFAILHKSEGKIAALDVAGENCMTFYHYVEEMENAPNRFHKIFKGQYIDFNGIETTREFGLFARNLEMRVETDVKPMEEYLWSKGYYSGCRPGEGNCLHVIKAKDVYDESAELIRNGKSLNMLYKIGKEF